MRNIPTLITLTRLLLAAVVAWAAFEASYGLAAVVFVIAAASDLADGPIARRYALVTELGARLDAVADKILMLAAVVPLLLQGLLPWWLALCVVGRDVLIVAGAVSYHMVVGSVEMAPTLLSKANTLLAVVTVAAVLARASGLGALSPLLEPLFALTLVLTLISGLQYVWIWSRRALAARRDAAARGAWTGLAPGPGWSPGLAQYA
jgi:cardiolipin synthase